MTDEKALRRPVRCEVEKKVFRPARYRFKNAPHESLGQFGGGIRTEKFWMEDSDAFNSFANQSWREMTHKDLNFWQFRHAKKTRVIRRVESKYIGAATNREHADPQEGDQAKVDARHGPSAKGRN